VPVPVRSVLVRKFVWIVALACAVTSLVSVAPAVAALVPVVSAVSPSSGSTAGGTTVTVTGTNLTGALDGLSDEVHQALPEHAVGRPTAGTSSHQSL
jgi:hypothetical protein